MTYLWTSECVSAGHPDKVADQISDAILDAYLEKDPNSKVAVETLVTENTIIVAGEVTSLGMIDVEKVARDTVYNIGYTCDEYGLDGKKCDFISKIHKQSPQINKAVVISDKELGAGDQGIMFGYATNETPNFMPLTIFLARLTIESLRHCKGKLLPDAKSQVTIEYDETGAKHVDTILVSTQHVVTLRLEEVKELVRVQLHKMISTLPTKIASLFDDKTKYIINPGGVWNYGGPAADTGLTGRKIVVDNYGADCPIGGGAFSGKDPSKVDRSAAYAARHLAKNIVAQGLASYATVQLSYAIGISEPISVRVKLDSDKELNVKPKVSFSPSGIIERLYLKNPIYLPTAKYGHFGFKPEGKNYAWETLNEIL